MDRHRRGNLRIGLLVLAAVLLVTASTGSLGSVPAATTDGAVHAARDPFPRRVTFVDGTITPSLSPSQRDADLSAYYDRWKADHVVSFGAGADGEPLYRIGWNPGQEDETVSEGIGYGMLIVVHLAGHDPEAQRLFDGLFRFSRLHPSAGDHRLTQWHVPVATWDQAYAAFDGDADIALALLLADRQWGSGGRVAYRSEAITIITALADNLLAPDSGLPLPGDATRLGGLSNEEQSTVRLSDVMVDNFRAFHRATGDERWLTALEQGRTAINSLQQRFSAGTGLVPDWAVAAGPGAAASASRLRPADPHSVEGAASDGIYSYNAARVPWRIGLDAVLTGDRRSVEIVAPLSRWAEAATDGDPARLVSGYGLDGVPQGSGFSTAFVAPLAVAAMTQPSQQAWLDALYGAVRATHQSYYDDTVTLLCLLVLTGNLLDPV